MEYKWTVTGMQVAEDNLVVKVNLMVTGTEGENSAFAAYARTFVRGDSFIPYEQLTEQQVLDWCFAPEVITVEDQIQNTTTTITKHLKDEGETQVTGQIQRQLAQKQSEPALPWAQIPA